MKHAFPLLPTCSHLNIPPEFCVQLCTGYLFRSFQRHRSHEAYLVISHWWTTLGGWKGGRNEVLLLLTGFIWVSFRLQAEQTSQKRSWRLQLLLPKRGPKAFSSFCSALRATDQQHLCDLLTQTQEPNGDGTHVEASVSHALFPKHWHAFKHKAGYWLPCEQVNWG